MAGAVRVHYFRCPECNETKSKLVGVTNVAIKPTFVEFCKHGHTMDTERVEER